MKLSFVTIPKAIQAAIWHQTRGRTATVSAGSDAEGCDICATFGKEYIRAQKTGESERAELILLVLDGHKQARHSQPPARSMGIPTRPGTPDSLKYHS